jgi:hypothetical protein
MALGRYSLLADSTQTMEFSFSLCGMVNKVH